MTRRSLMTSLFAWFGWWGIAKSKPEAEMPPTWERHGDIAVAIGAAAFSRGTLIVDAKVGGDVLFHFRKDELTGWVPEAALPVVAKTLREVHGLTTWDERRLGEPTWLKVAPPPPEKLDRVFRMTQEERIARLGAIEKISPLSLAVVIQDQEIDLGRWRTGVRLLNPATDAARLKLAEEILETMESRLRIWLDRYIDRF